MPVDIMKRMMPKPWGTMPFFHQIQELEAGADTRPLFSSN
jgi:hypothetical protein